MIDYYVTLVDGWEEKFCRYKEKMEATSLSPPSSRPITMSSRK
jgi:hypothetical protein